MKTKNCEEVMDTYLALDKNERIPLAVTLHLLTCKTCRTQVRLLTRAEGIAARPLAVATPLTDSSITDLMQKIIPSWSAEKAKPVSMHGWIFGGILMVLFMLAFGFFHGAIHSETLLLSFYLVFALAVTAYCAIFVAANLDFFVKKIGTIAG